MKNIVLRLKPGDDLKQSIINLIKSKNISAGYVAACVGSLKRAKLRMADENEIVEFKHKFEIVSLVGTLCRDGVHLHISLSDRNGKVIGGHLKDGCIIYTTAEIIIAVLDKIKFERKMDYQTNFKELIIKDDN